MRLAQLKRVFAIPLPFPRKLEYRDNKTKNNKQISAFRELAEFKKKGGGRNDFIHCANISHMHTLHDNINLIYLIELPDQTGQLHSFFSASLEDNFH